MPPKGKKPAREGYDDLERQFNKIIGSDVPSFSEMSEGLRSLDTSTPSTTSKKRVRAVQDTGDKDAPPALRPDPLKRTTTRSQSRRTESPVATKTPTTETTDNNGDEQEEGTEQVTESVEDEDETMGNAGVEDIDDDEPKIYGDQVSDAVSSQRLDKVVAQSESSRAEMSSLTARLDSLAKTVNQTSKDHSQLVTLVNKLSSDIALLQKGNRAEPMGPPPPPITTEKRTAKSILSGADKNGGTQSKPTETPDAPSSSNQLEFKSMHVGRGRPSGSREG